MARNEWKQKFLKLNVCLEFNARLLFYEAAQKSTLSLKHTSVIWEVNIHFSVMDTLFCLTTCFTYIMSLSLQEFQQDNKYTKKSKIVYVHTIKAYEDRHSPLNTRWRTVISFTHQPHYPPSAWQTPW